jgi:VWFA-related protein
MRASRVHGKAGETRLKPRVPVTLLLLCVMTAAAQEGPSFQAETRVVQVPVTVTDAGGKNVEGLTARDFTVLADGQPQAVTLDTFGSGAAPISLAIAIQASGVSAAALGRIRRIGVMIQPLVIGRRGEAAVLTFADEIDWHQDFTSDPDRIQRAVKNLKPSATPQARMLDAIIDAADSMKTRKGRRILLLISETRDRGSHAKLEAALGAVEREGVEIFAAPYSAYTTTMTSDPEELPSPSGANYISVFTELARLGRTNDVQALTQATGGSAYPFVKERGIEKSIENLGVEVHSQYILSFAQGKVGTGMHRIEVLAARRGDLRVHSRKAWWAE